MQAESVWSVRRVGGLVSGVLTLLLVAQLEAHMYMRMTPIQPDHEAGPSAEDAAWTVGQWQLVGERFSGSAPAFPKASTPLMWPVEFHECVLATARDD